MKQILVTCGCCQGNGKTPLPKHLQQTLHVIKKHSPCTTSQIYQHLQRPEIDRSSVNQFLKKLLVLKLVKAKKEPRSLRVYLPV